MPNRPRYLMYLGGNHHNANAQRRLRYLLWDGSMEIFCTL